ncbi:UDP-N-acetyl-D-mannosamine dehydrogenase [Cellulosimicrobium cellulans]|uniref:UDP-N-acetyl-D-mannosamine dehydrogenase n=1 Tax=Cellulosimicrobium cellulans TaxID=1710 RepID=UPI0021CB42FD|nr:UDP-N-acetyl-D-mannosamine dehydrogenase [Cellulosimicrobium cellulans]
MSEGGCGRLDGRRVAVVGLGYIGLPTAAVLASHGADVVGVDVDTGVVAAVNRGEVPFVEPGLGVAVAGAVARGALRAQRDVPEADVYVVAVPTPLGADGGADLSCVDAAADAIAPRLRPGALVVLESTSPPGTTHRLAERLLAERPDLRPLDGEVALHVAHCPERVLPGRVLTEIVENDRVIGGITPACARLARDVYAAFCRGSILLTDALTAELSKLAENAYRDVNIAFANELSLIADALGADVWRLIELANRHPRVDILQPGPGVGGHCIAVDPWFLVGAAPARARLIRTAREVNDAQPGVVVDRVRAAVSGLERPRIAALGLAFKPDIDDLRASPAVEVVGRLAALLPRASIEVVEPHVPDLPDTLARFANVTLATLEEATRGADLIVVLVDHAPFRAVGREQLRLDEAVTVDTRGLWR